jgi:hypothetical protein
MTPDVSPPQIARSLSLAGESVILWRVLGNLFGPEMFSARANTRGSPHGGVGFRKAECTVIA